MKPATDQLPAGVGGPDQHQPPAHLPAYLGRQARGRHVLPVALHRQALQQTWRQDRRPRYHPWPHRHRSKLAIVAERVRIGDWEVDTIVGAGRQGAILRASSDQTGSPSDTDARQNKKLECFRPAYRSNRVGKRSSLVDRVSRYTLLHKLEAAQAEPTTHAIITKLRPHHARVHTITADNGEEFAFHARVVRRLKADFYFAASYHAWKRGLNENTNGLERQYFPKGSCFAISPRPPSPVCKTNSTRGRERVLGYETPNEVFFAPYRRPDRLTLYAFQS